MTKSYHNSSEINSNSDNQNIYKTARKTTTISQESAAEILGVSVESIRAYETGRRIPSNEMVAGMIDLYSAPWLAPQHIRASSDFAKSIVPDVQEMPLERAGIKAILILHELQENDIAKKILSIVEDGIVDETESADFKEIMDKLNELNSVALSLKIARGDNNG